MWLLVPTAFRFWILAVGGQWLTAKSQELNYRSARIGLLKKSEYARRMPSSSSVL